MIMTTIFGGGPLIEVALGVALALVPPTVLTIHYGLYSAGYVLLGATWIMLGFIAYLYTVRPTWAIPNWMREQGRRDRRRG